ncbi:MAG TPA: hypothetical protein DIS53_03655 [Candidatus Wildermuthbacteria bacterium]|nr:MAG: hypothetical protein A2674_00390 [Candidatus Wildermuthbacteria bacterium RIFCSPHIGHO2_01_FULL_50_47]HCM36993.1 hypothetical protein [Candidatus Wildermuthbacteria bacterium]
MADFDGSSCSLRKSSGWQQGYKNIVSLLPLRKESGGGKEETMKTEQRRFSLFGAGWAPMADWGRIRFFPTESAAADELRRLAEKGKGVLGAPLYKVVVERRGLFGWRVEKEIWR